jgi:hypothetical protein
MLPKKERPETGAGRDYRQGPREHLPAKIFFLGILDKKTAFANLLNNSR